MAWGVFVFSREGRERVAGVLRALLIVQLVVSLGIVIFTYNVSLKVMLLLKNIHQVKVVILYGLILLHAYAMKLHFTGGLRLVALMLKCPMWPRISRYTNIWMFFGSVIPANGILMYAACRSTLKALTKELSGSLCYGISKYLTEPFWKRLLDTMQIELSCCGAEMPSDWHDIPWINMDFLNEESDVVLRLAGADGKVLPPVSPYSCCTPRVLAACYHDPLQQAEWGALWSGLSPLPPASLHARGCVEAVKTVLTKALLGLHCFTMLVVILQMVILCLFQLLRTSARDAVLRGDANGAGRGALHGVTLVDGTHSPHHTTKKPHQVEAPVNIPECLCESSICAISLTRRRKRRRKVITNSNPNYRLS